MKQQKNNQSIILLVENISKRSSQIKDWLESNNLTARETINIYDALDEISDFTAARCPDVFMLPVDSLLADSATIEELIEVYSETGGILVATFSDADGIVAYRNNSGQHLSKTQTKTPLLPRYKSAAPTNNIL